MQINNNSNLLKAAKKKGSTRLFIGKAARKIEACVPEPLHKHKYVIRFKVNFLFLLSPHQV